MQKIRAWRGGSANRMEPFPLRPRYLHHRKYERLRARSSSLSRQNTADLAGFLFPLKAGIPTYRVWFRCLSDQLKTAQVGSRPAPVIFFCTCFCTAISAIWALWPLPCRKHGARTDINGKS